MPKRAAIPYREFKFARPQSQERDKPRPHSRHMEFSGPIFSSGEPVRQTGIYEVIHDQAHRTAHEVVMLNGDSFPPCETCDQRVRFRLVRTAPYIFQDEDFGEQA